MKPIAVAALITSCLLGSLAAVEKVHVVVAEVVTATYLGLSDDGGADDALGAAAEALELEPIPEGGEISALLTDPQFQVLLRAMTKAGVKRKVLAKRAVESGGEIRLPAGADLESITPTAANGLKVGVALKLRGEKEPRTERIWLWDGMTVTFTRRTDEGDYKTTFITTRIIDAAPAPRLREPLVPRPVTRANKRMQPAT